jgi:hypothetical protein
MRTGIENHLRFLLLANGQAIDDIDTVEELFTEAKALKVAKNTELKNRIGTLKASYGVLSKHVHTATASHLSLHKNLAGASGLNPCGRTYRSCPNQFYAL